jgi:hypothetical protein
MALGKTHYNWRPDVKVVVEEIERKWPGAVCNTYEGHPFPGWDGRSIDVWADGGRGDPINRKLGGKIYRWLGKRPGGPRVRHRIYEHRWWTDWAGSLIWEPDDHSGFLRHVHVTYF